MNYGIRDIHITMELYMSFKRSCPFLDGLCPLIVNVPQCNNINYQSVLLLLHPQGKRVSTTSSLGKVDLPFDPSLGLEEGYEGGVETDL